MRRTRRRLPIPQYEFGFAPDAFNLITEIGIDGDRVARERAEAEAAKRLADTAQAPLFAPEPSEHSPSHEH
jgi:hypothetical protein